MDVVEPVWTWEWPKKSGLYLAYGDWKGVLPKLIACTCSMTIDGVQVYTSTGNFLREEDGWKGVFRLLEVPADAVALFNAGPPGVESDRKDR